MRDIKVRYFLKAKNKDINNRTAKEKVYAEVSCSFKRKENHKTIYEKFQFSLECSISPHHFGIIKEKRGKLNYIYDDGKTINIYSKLTKPVRDKIALFETYINNAQSYFTTENLEPTVTELKEYLMFNSGRKDRKVRETFYITDFIKSQTDYLYTLIDTGDSEEVSKATIINRATLINILKRYEETTKKQLTFESLTENIYKDIWIILDDITKGIIKIDSYKRKVYKKTGLAANSVKQYQTNLLLMCREAQKQGIEIGLNPNNHDLIRKVDTNVTSEKVKAILTENDILEVINYQTKKANLKLAKNYIIIASLMGMRYQTMKHTNGKKIETYSKNNVAFQFIHNIQIKTKTECHTPLFKDVLSILQKNGNEFPDFTNLKLYNLNKNIRKVLKEIGIKNYQLFSTHNLRSTFITNLNLMEVSEKHISYVTHPRKKDRSSSVHIYNRTNMADKAKQFYDAVLRANQTNQSILYNF